MKNNIVRYKLKSGIRYRYRFYYKGTVYQKSGFVSAKEAKEEKYRRYFEVKNANNCDILFKDLVTEYLSYIENDIKRSTYINIKTMITQRILKYFSDYKVKDINTKNIHGWQKQLKQEKLSSLYLRRIQSILKNILRYAVVYKELQRNPLDLVDNIVKIAKPRGYNIWNKEEFEYFYRNIESLEYRCIYTVLFYTGIRIGELRGLKWSDIQLQTKEKIIHIKRTRSNDTTDIKDYQTLKTEFSERSIVICDRTYNILFEWYKYSIDFSDGYVFKINRATLASHLRRNSKKLGLKKIRVHDLRHSHACLLLELGVNIADICRRLGHRSIQTTMDIYGKQYFGNRQLIVDKLNKINI